MVKFELTPETTADRRNSAEVYLFFAFGTCALLGSVNWFNVKREKAENFFLLKGIDNTSFFSSR
jgi:hypothetical protein